MKIGPDCAIMESIKIQEGNSYEYRNRTIRRSNLRH